MKKIYILIILCNIHFLQAQNVGINTTAPTKMLDVNGELRIRTLPTGTGLNNLVVADAAGNILKRTISVNTANVGDIKDSYSNADHDGWYLLNGRSLASLSATAQANANTLGFNAVLPDFAGAYTKTAGATETVNIQGGSPTIGILKANLPQYNLNAVTNNPGNHQHTNDDEFTTYGSLAAGPTVGAYDGGGYNWYLSVIHTLNTAAAGNHSHTFTLSSNGSNQPINLSPAYIALKSFVYLGN